MIFCIQCHSLLSRASTKYCSNQCQGDYQHAQYIERWKRGEVSGSRGINARTISRHIRRYLFNKYGDRCSVCRWGIKNTSTGEVPLEIDHIDGNAENNAEENLKPLCPNCHSLTPSYRNLNKGNGRTWRRERYLRVHK